jgi:predicted nucleic acid-binding Zn ribbon protein
MAGGLQKIRSLNMVMPGMNGYPLKCEGCGHTDALMFNVMRDRLKEVAFKIKGYKKCPKCGAKMRVDPDVFIKF